MLHTHKLYKKKTRKLTLLLTYFIGWTTTRTTALVDVRVASLGYRLSDISADGYGQLSTEIGTRRELTAG